MTPHKSHADPSHLLARSIPRCSTLDTFPYRSAESIALSSKFQCRLQYSYKRGDCPPPKPPKFKLPLLRASTPRLAPPRKSFSPRISRQPPALLEYRSFSRKLRYSSQSCLFTQSLAFFVAQSPPCTHQSTQPASFTISEIG